MMKDLFDGLVI